MKNLKLSLALLLCSAAFGQANAGYYDIELKPEHPSMGIGVALFAENPEYVWVSLEDDLESFNRLKNVSTSNNINNDFHAVRMRLYGINTNEYKSSPNDKIKNIWIESNSFVRKHTDASNVKYYCLTMSLDGSPSCIIESATQEDNGDILFVNLNTHLLEKGLSKLSVSNYTENSMNKKLAKYEQKAKSKNIGVWKEMFNLFEL